MSCLPTSLLSTISSLLDAAAQQQPKATTLIGRLLGSSLGSQVLLTPLGHIFCPHIDRMSRRGGTSTSKGGGKKDKEVIDWEAVARLDEDCKELRAYRWSIVIAGICEASQTYGWLAL